MMIADAWQAAARLAAVETPLPPEEVLVDSHIMLLGALIPRAAGTSWGLPVSAAPRFLAVLHGGIAAAVAERLRRREELMALARSQGAQTPEPVAGEEVTPCPLPAERRLSVADLRTVERHRQLQLPVSASSSSSTSVAVAGEPRRRWLRQRLVALINEDMLVCPHNEGVAAVGVLELFERRTGEAFSDTPGSLVGSRVRGMAKVLGNLSREEQFDHPLLQAMRRSLIVWNRRPCIGADVTAWYRSRQLPSCSPPDLQQGILPIGCPSCRTTSE